MGPLGDYHFLAASGVSIGAVLSSRPVHSLGWTYYIGVNDIDAAVEALKAGGGQLLDGPHPIPGGEFSAHACDPQGARFGLLGPRTAG